MPRMYTSQQEEVKMKHIDTMMMDLRKKREQQCFINAMWFKEHMQMMGKWLMYKCSGKKKSEKNKNRRKIKQ